MLKPKLKVSSVIMLQKAIKGYYFVYFPLKCRQVKKYNSRQ